MSNSKSDNFKSGLDLGVSEIKSFRDLVIWQKAMSLVTAIYRETRKYPEDEKFGLSGQIRRCAVSVPSNIAEGYGRQSTKDYVRFLQIALGSLYEIDTQMEIVSNLCYSTKDDIELLSENISEISKMLNGLIRKLKTSA